MTSLYDQLREECAAVGIEYREVPADGKFYATDIEGDPAGKGDGRITLFPDGVGGFVCNWKGGRRVFFTNTGVVLTKEEREEQAHRRAKAIRDAKQEELRHRAEAREISAAILRLSSPARPDHPYLLRKQIDPVETLREIEASVAAQTLNYRPKSHGEFLHGRLLIAPIMIGKRISSLEFIDEDGRKSAISGGAKAKGYWTAQPLPKGIGIGLTIQIGEGVATVLSAKMATGFVSVAALSCSNVPKVAAYMRKCYPQAQIVILADLGNGEEHAAHAADSVEGILAVPNFGSGRPERASDFNDMLVNCGVAAVRQVITDSISSATSAAERDCVDASDTDERGLTRSALKEIDVTDRNLGRLTGEAWAVLHSFNQPVPFIFRRGHLVRIERDDNDVPLIREMTPDRLRHSLARLASWHEVFERKGKLSVFPPADVVRDILATPDPKLPVLVRIARAPFFASDGTLVTTPGYNPSTKVFYSPTPDLNLPLVPPVPSDSEVREAANLILEPFEDFPFASKTEKAHTVGLLVAPFVRELIDGPTPLHLIEKPAPGTGATLLVDSIALVANGQDIPVMTEARDEEEWRKRITAKLAQGPTFVFIDNLGRQLDSPSLSAALTTRIWEDRLLGRSETVSYPVSCVWIATGNNPTLSNEIARRTVRIRLDAQMEQPWLRSGGFRHPDLRRWIRRERSRLVWAVLVVIQSWLSKNRPPSAKSLGRYEEWSEVIGGILQSVGIEGFLENLEEFYDTADTEASLWTNFIDRWWHRFGSRDVSVKDLFGLASDLPIGEGSSHSQKTRLGKLISDKRDRQFGGYRIEKRKVIHGNQQWGLKEMTGK